MSTKENGGFTEEELSLLGDEERAAVMDESAEETVDDTKKPVTDPEEKPAAAEPEKKAEAEPGKETPKEEPKKQPEKSEPEKVDPEKEPEPVETIAVEEPPKEEGKEPEIQSEPPQPPPKGQVKVDLPEDRQAFYKEQMDELNKKWEEGEIDVMGDYQDQRDSIRDAMRDEQDTLSEQATAKRDWEYAQNVFLHHNPLYLEKGNEGRYENLDHCVRAVVAAGKATSFEDVLAKAQKMEEAMSGVVPEPEKEPEPTPNPKKEVKEEKAKSPLPVKPDLGEMPTASAPEVDDSEFGNLDRLEGDEFEEALSNLSPEKRERYERLQ